MKKIILTGFEPFGGEKSNPSMEVALRLAGEGEGYKITSLILPVSFEKCAQPLIAALERERPDAVICLGQAGGRTAVTPEVVAINRMDTTLPDNDGKVYTDAWVREGGPAAYFSTLPVRAIVNALHKTNIPAALSYAAGTYVCNCLMYKLLDELNTRFPETVGGFIHIPYSSEQVAGRSNAPFSLPLNELMRAIGCCIQLL